MADKLTAFTSLLVRAEIRLSVTHSRCFESLVFLPPYYKDYRQWLEILPTQSSALTP